MKTYPMYEITKENRYESYLDFLARTFVSLEGGKIIKETFFEKLKEQGFDRRTLSHIWEKGAKEGNLFRGLHQNTLYIRKKSTDVVVSIEIEVARKVKSISDFTLLVVSLQSAKPNPYGNRSRTLRTIGKTTGTKYKATTSRRIKSAASKLGLDYRHRYTKVGDVTPQISNDYNFTGAIFQFNKLIHPTSFEGLEVARNKRQLKKNSYKVGIVKKGKLPYSSFYNSEDYSLLWDTSFRDSMLNF